MARQTITTLIDDFDGSEAQGTTSFGLDGKTYEIDLNERHDKEFRALLAPYVGAARKVRAASGRSTTPQPAATSKQRNAAVRDWAAGLGVDLNARGRIAGSVLAAYEAQDSDALFQALGLEVAKPKPRRARKAAEFSDPS